MCTSLEAHADIGRIDGTTDELFEIKICIPLPFDESTLHDKPNPVTWYTVVIGILEGPCYFLY